jgi:mono/diheme cytochrome c family protein
VRTTFLSMALALLACSEQSKTPPPPSASTVFKDAPSESPGASAAPQASPTPPPAPETPEQLFFSLGCKACHGPGSAYASLLVTARNKPAEEIARWILHPEQMRPGTMMPGYAQRLSQEQALALARWIKAGNPKPSQ